MTLPAVPLEPIAPGGPALSRIVAGVWRMAQWGMGPAERLRWIEAALDLGISSFDHADIYGDHQCEALFGEALAQAPGLRARLQLVSKCGIRLVSAQRPENRLKHYDTSAAHVRASVERSLQNLRTDHLDLLLVHRPDALMDPDELAETFLALRAEGKVRHFGVSNHTPSQFALLHRRVPLVTNQVELSPLHLAALHDGTLDQALDLGTRPMAWSPLAGGRLFAQSGGGGAGLLARLAGRGSDAGAGARLARVQAVLGRLASERGVSVATLAYAWVLRHPSRPLPLTGSGRNEALKEAVMALGVPLDRQAWYEVWQAAMGHEVP